MSCQHLCSRVICGWVFIGCFFSKLEGSVGIVLISMFLVLTIYKPSECCFIRVSHKLWCPRSLGALFLCAYFLLNQEIVLCQEQMELKPQKIWVPSAAQNPQILYKFPNGIKYTVSPSLTPHLPGSSYSQGPGRFSSPKDFPPEKREQTERLALGYDPGLSYAPLFKMPYKVREIKQEGEREIG